MSNLEVGSLYFGPSVNKPNMDEVIDNTNGYSWLTIENTLPVPILVTPVNRNAGINTSISLGTHIPGMTKCTVPIDPDMDVSVICLAQGQTFKGFAYSVANGFFSNTGKITFAKRQIRYTLHNIGNASQFELFPPQSWIAWGAAQGYYSVGGVGSQNIIMLYVNPPVSSNAQYETLLGDTVQPYLSDLVLMAVTFSVWSYTAFDETSSNGLQFRPFYDYNTNTKLHTSFGASVAPFLGKPADGMTATIRMPGALGFTIENGANAANAGGNPAIILVTPWVVFPAQ